MKKKPCLLFICLNLLIICFPVSCKGGDAKEVYTLPDGFVSQIELNNREDKILRIVLWEQDIQVSFMDSDNICIYQTNGRDSSLVVKYKKEYYINEAKYLELTDIALLALEKRQQVYHLGDEVEIRGAGETIYTVRIISLDTGETEPYYTDALTTYNINYTVSSNLTVNKQIELIGSVITRQGVEYSNLIFTDAGTVSVKIRGRGGDKIEAITLRSPEYHGLTYRIIAYQ